MDQYKQFNTKILYQETLNEIHKIKFQVDYLTKICKIAKKMKDVKIQVPFKNGEPLNFGFTTENGSQLDFILATKF